MTKPTTVSELNEQIKTVLDTTFSLVYIEGEISNLTYHNSGHIYFSLKDNKSTISCVMFKGNANYLKFRLEIGTKVTVQGNLTVYAPRGNYQLLCRKIEPSGVGALALAYEQLKARLQIKGYFNSNLKKQLPRYPKSIFVITSNTGAAIEDMKKILAIRYPLTKMILLPTLVQGIGSKENIVENIIKADLIAQQTQDAIIIVGRGGGSTEDLWAFNEECVADAIYNAKTPIISAVGHENDFLISDLVADLRASTPSNAIEISTPDINDLRQYTDHIYTELNNKFKTILTQKSQILNYLFKSFTQHSLTKRFEQINIHIIQLKKQLNNQFLQKLNQKENRLKLLNDQYKQNHPTLKDKKGYVQLSQNNTIKILDEVSVGEQITLQNSKFGLKCNVLDKYTL